MSHPTPLKILWSIDAFDDSSDLQSRAALFLDSLAKAQPIEVEPIYVLSPDQLGLAVEFLPPWIEQYEPAARKALEVKLKDLKIPGLKPAQVLSHRRASLSGSVAVLNQYAVAQGFDMILVGTHGRKGLQRMVLGSFAEELLLQSKVSVTILGPDSKIETRYPPHILFPTDLEAHSKVSFERVLDLARKLQARLTLLHAIPRPSDAVFQSGVYLLSGGWVPVPLYMQEEHSKQRNAAERWKAIAQEKGLTIDCLMDSDSPSVTESILKHAASLRATMIVAAAQSGAIESALIGSITRQVARAAPCPTWVFPVHSTGK